MVWNAQCHLAGFARAKAGNVAITFAIATLPVIGGVGAAVDYSHANSVKVALQAALDSTALMLSKEATSDTSAQLRIAPPPYSKLAGSATAWLRPPSLAR